MSRPLALNQTFNHFRETLKAQQIQTAFGWLSLCRKVL